MFHGNSLAKKIKGCKVIQNIKRKHGCNGTLKNDKLLMFQGNQINNIKDYIINNGIDINNIHIKG